MTDDFLKGLLSRINDSTKPVDAADRNLVIRALSSSTRTQGADAPAIIQCDGCMAGHIIGQSGLHEHEGRGYMACQAKRYGADDAQPVAITEQQLYTDVREFLSAKDSMKVIAAVGNLLATCDAAPSDAQTIWERFPGYLIDHHEGDTITEEFFQLALSNMLRADRLAASAPRDKS